MEEKIIKDIYIISNIESVKADIEKDAEHEIDLEEMANFIEAEARTEFYFSDTLKSESEIKNVNRVWLDTGYTTPKGEAIFISLMKFEQKDSEPRYIFNGFYVGTAEYLVRGMCKSNKSKRGEIRTNFTRFKTKCENKIQKRERKHLNINANKNQILITNPEEERQTAVTIQEISNKQKNRRNYSDRPDPIYCRRNIRQTLISNVEFKERIRTLFKNLRQKNHTDHRQHMGEKRNGILRNER